MKTCKHCGGLFERRTNSHKYCEDCVPLDEGVLRSRQLLNYYKMCRSEFEAMYFEQDGTCLICGFWEARAVDHDHACCPGVPTCGICTRGLLCTGCNVNLEKYEAGSGYFLPQVEQYLDNYRE